MNIKNKNDLIFKNDQPLSADDLNQLYQLIIQQCEKHGLIINQIFTWTNGVILSANELNVMLEEINNLYRHLKKPVPIWSFGKFENGKILKAEHLNELVTNVKNLSSTS